MLHCLLHNLFSGIVLLVTGANDEFDCEEFRDDSGSCAQKVASERAHSTAKAPTLKAA